MGDKSPEKRNANPGLSTDSQPARPILSDIVRETESILQKCELCPRKCHVNKTTGEDERGIAARALLIRHLVLPEGIAGTDGVVKFIAEEVSKNTYINIMNQYHPCFRAFSSPPLNRRITDKEYRDAIKLAMDAGLKRIDGVTV